MDFTDDDRQALLEAPGLLARARKLLEILVREQQMAELKNEIQEKVKHEIDKQQRDYYLQQQMRTIQDELGDSSDAEIDRMHEAAAKKNWPEEVGELFEKELAKVERLNPAVAEYSVQMTYLQLMLELPWNDVTKDNLDMECARKQLDDDHFGLEEVKDRILEHLAVIKLKGDLKSPILCLYGPPGVGKTSLGRSVATALGRKFGRISLGGLHDESEIRGHRRTYIGPRRPQIQTGRPQARRSHKADDGRSLLLSHNAIEPQQPPDSKEHIDSHRCRQQHFHDIKQPHLPSPFFSLHEPKLQNKGTAYGKSLSPHTMPLSSTPLTQTTPASYRSMPISSENPSAHPQNRTVYPL